MLLFSSGTFTVDGLTVFPDHADPNQFWYLPGPVALANLAGSTEPQFLLIMYAPDVASSGVKGVGFLNVTVALKLSDTAHAKIMGQIRVQFPNADNPVLSPVPFDDGSVQIVALDLQGGGGTNASLPAGAFEAVEHILGATSPELFGENDALFALTLSEDGASILQAAFKDNMAPVGVIYSMKFTGARPAIDVKITANLKRVYDSFSVDLTATACYVSAGIDATFEKLRQDGTIKVEVTNLTTDAANAEKEQWALSLFKDSIMSQWFTPSLSPTTAAAADASSLSLTVPNASSGSAAKPATGSVPTPPATTHTTPTMGTVPASASTMRPATPTTPATTAPAAGAATTPAAGAPGAPAAGAPGAPAAGAPGAPAAGTPGAPGAAARPAATTPASAASAAKALPGTAAAASSAAAPFGVALRLKFVSQDELKTVEIDYSRMDAVQRVYAPQGYFGLMLNQIDQSKHFLQVDGTDPFFNQFAVTVNPPHDFTGIGLLAAHVAIDYGDPASPSALKHGEFLFDPAHTTQQVWQVYQGAISTTQYHYTADYKFDPESGWNGEQTSYTVPTVTTENRVLNLDPHDFLGFLQVVVSAGRIDANLVDRIEVALSYTAPSGWSTATTLIVKPGSAPQSWKLRLADKTQTTYTYATTCYLKDGTAFPTKPVTSTASAILVSDPFVGALDLLFEPALDPSTKLAIVELGYQDPANNYGFQTSFEIQGATPTSSRVHIPLVDRTQTQYQYRITAISSTNQQSQGAYVAAQDPLILVKTSPPTSS